MRLRPTGDFIPLRAFWADLAHDACAAAPPPPEPAEVARTLDAHFNGLVQHAIPSLRSLPLIIRCDGCQNNQTTRRASICETHAGALEGILEAVLDMPLDVTYRPDSGGGGCTLQLTGASGEDGRGFAVWARRAAHISLDAFDQGLFVIDTRTEARTAVNAPAWRLLNDAGEPRPTSAFASRLGLDPAFTEQLVKEARRRAWIEVELRPSTE